MVLRKKISVNWDIVHGLKNRLAHWHNTNWGTLFIINKAIRCPCNETTKFMPVQSSCQLAKRLCNRMHLELERIHSETRIVAKTSQKMQHSSKWTVLHDDTSDEHCKHFPVSLWCCLFLTIQELKFFIIKKYFNFEFLRVYSTHAILSPSILPLLFRKCASLRLHISLKCCSDSRICLENTNWPLYLFYFDMTN